MGAAIALPTNQLAAAGECEAIEALATGSKAKLRNIAVAINREDKLELTYEGKRSFLRNADLCEIDLSGDRFDLECEWEFDTDQAAAKGLFSAYRIRIANCIALPFNDVASPEAYGSTIVLSRYESRIERSDGTESSLQLELLETNYGNARRFVVSLDARRD